MVDLLPFAIGLWNSQTKSKPAVRVPPDAILLSGNKSMQKCLLLAEGYALSPGGYGFQQRQRREPALCMRAYLLCYQHGVLGPS